jgi:hypothetical protein
MVTNGFNPLDKEVLADTFVRVLTEQRCVPLDSFYSGRTITPKGRYGKETVQGAGVYALYYEGPFPDYAPLALAGCKWPIYIGKAEAPGSRKGDVWSPSPTRKGPLLDRLSLHKASIEWAGNLNASHFRARWLAIDEAFIVTAEVLLVKRYRPLWNAQVDGFGSKAVGGPRQGGYTSKWDTFHSGRRNVGGVGKFDIGEIRREIAAHLAAFPPRPRSPYAR